MKAELFSILRCPFCAAQLGKALELAGTEDAMDYGTLECPDCRFEFPVVAGIPIMRHQDDRMDMKAETTAESLSDGPLVGDLLRKLRERKPMEALALLLSPTSDRGRLFPELPKPNHHTEGNAPMADCHREVREHGIRLKRGGRLLRKLRNLYRKTVLPRARMRLAEYLEKNAANLTAIEVVDLYYRQFSGTETYNYFSFRFGQPRHLAGLDLASLLTEGKGPILDLACGLGHLTHFFASQPTPRPIVGVDRDFFRLLVASRYVAPSAHFVCCPADDALPFDDATFSGVFCSDAFHYFLNRASCVHEMLRILDAMGTLVLSRIGNGEADPKEGYELKLSGYRRLLGGVRHVFLGEDDLVARYLEKKGPNLSEGASLEELQRQKWLSLVASRNPAVFSEKMEFKVWPHALGRLRLNPIYRVSGEDQNGELDLHFEFPSKWYEYENKAYLSYAQEDCHIDREAAQALRVGTSGPELEKYIRSFVVIGTPESYC